MSTLSTFVPRKVILSSAWGGALWGWTSAMREDARLIALVELGITDPEVWGAIMPIALIPIGDVCVVVADGPYMIDEDDGREFILYRE